MTVIDIVRKYLENNSYDGLFEDDSECGCTLYELCPCDEGIRPFCQPGVYYRDRRGRKTMGTKEDAAKHRMRESLTHGKIKRPSAVPRSNRDGGTVGYDPMPGD